MTIANAIPEEWYAITFPANVNWDKNSKTKTVDTYGSNGENCGNAQLLSNNNLLGDCLLEGFSAAMQVEDVVLALEACMTMIIDEGSGYAAPYCWSVYAGPKKYGVFVIKSISVNEVMRDMSGKATRAKVDLVLQEVSPLQVNAGTDITSTAVQGSLSQEGELALQQQAQSQSSTQDAAVAGAKGGGKGGGRSPGSPGSPSSPSSPSAPSAPSNPASGDGGRSRVEDAWLQNNPGQVIRK